MWPNPQFPAHLVTFTEKILNENFIFCAVLVSYLYPETESDYIDNIDV